MAGKNVGDRVAVERVHYCGDHACRRRNGQTDEILAMRRAGIPGLRILLDVETRQARRSADQKQEGEKCAPARN